MNNFFDGIKYATSKQNVIDVLRELFKNDTNVKGIYYKTGAEQSVTSLILSKLRKYGFVKGKRSGKSIVYSFRYTEIKTLYGQRNYNELIELLK